LFTPSPIGTSVAVTVIVPGVVTAAVAVVVTVTWTSMESVAVKLGEVPAVVPGKETVTVLADAVTFWVTGLNVTGLVGWVAVPAVRVNPNVTP